MSKIRPLEKDALSEAQVSLGTWLSGERVYGGSLAR